MSTLATLERWSIRRWNHSPDLASVLQEIYNLHTAGRIMIHLSDNGRVQAIEFCQRTTERCEYVRASGRLQHIEDVTHAVLREMGA
jgi:hypothetical protein